jgi:hypothetical protein
MGAVALTDVEDGRGQLDVAKVTGADTDVLLARGARELAVNGAELGVVEALVARLGVGLVHGLRVDDVHDAHGLDLLGREQPELDLFDGPERLIKLVCLAPISDWRYLHILTALARREA